MEGGMGERSAPIEGCGFAQSRPAGTASLWKRAKCPHEDRVNTSPLRGRGVWGNEVSPQGGVGALRASTGCGGSLQGIHLRTKFLQFLHDADLNGIPVDVDRFLLL